MAKRSIGDAGASGAKGCRDPLQRCLYFVIQYIADLHGLLLVVIPDVIGDIGLTPLVPFLNES